MNLASSLNPSACQTLSDHLTDSAHADLMTTLRSYGTSPSESHSAVLKDLLHDYAEMSLGSLKGRLAWPLAVGSGKTQSIISFIGALDRLGLNDVSVLIAQEKVEALCDTKRDLIAKGVPAEEIGLAHSKRYDPNAARAFRDHGTPLPEGYASEPSSFPLSGTYEQSRRSAGSFRYLLLTHSLLKARQDLSQFNTYRDRDRNLIIWDESLIKSRGRNMDLRSIQDGLLLARGRLDEALGDAPAIQDPAARRAVEFIEFCLKELQRHEGTTERLPEKTDDELKDFSEGLQRLMLTGAGNRNREHFGQLKDFLGFTQDPLRFVSTGQGKGIITYDLLIPAELQNVIVLDASYVIRELEKQDKSIKFAPSFRQTKGFCNVTVRQLKFNGGRNTMKDAVKADGPLVKTVVDYVSDLPETEGVILFTYKQRPGDRKSHEEILKSALKRAGVDIDATAEFEINGQSIKKPRFVWLCWGNETGLSKHSYCRNVLMVGIYRRSHLDLSAALAGQKESLDHQKVDDHSLIKEVERTEMFHSLMQAIGRGSCRETVDGEARPMRAAFIGKESFDDLFRETLPGVRLEEWRSEYLKEEDGLIHRSSITLKATLDKLPADQLKVSSTALKREAGLNGVAKQTFTLALTKALRDSGEWVRGLRSVVRVEHAAI